MIILLYSVIDILLSGKLFILRNIAVGSALFICSFLIISQTLFALAIYSLTTTFLLISLIAIIAISCVFFVKYKTIRAVISIDKIRYLPLSLLVIVAAGLVFTWLKSDIQGMGSDQGVYQQNAIIMANGIESNVLTFKEYDILESDYDRQLFLQRLAEQRFTDIGKYIILHNENRGTIEPGAYPPNSAILHGFQNVPAILSVSAMTFGIEHMMHGLTLPYITAIILIYIMLNVNLSLSKLTTSIATAVFMISPSVLMTSKAALTEIYLALIITLFLFLLTSKDKKYSYLLWIPVSAFAFTHVSIYIIMPMFVILFIGLALQKKDLGAWASGVLSLLLYGAGFLVMSYSSPEYTFDHYYFFMFIFNSLGMNIGRDSTQFLPVFSVISAMLVVFGFIYYNFFYRNRKGIDISKHIASVFMFVMVLCILMIFYRWYNITNYNPSHLRGMITTIPNLPIFAYAFGTGFVLLAAVVIRVLTRDKALAAENVMPITFMLLYTVVIYSAFIRTYITRYYYETRYLVPYIPVIVAMGAVSIDKLRVWSKTAVAILSAVVLLPFASALAVNQDFSRMEFRAYGTIIETVRSFEPGSVIVINSELSLSIFNEISMTSDHYAFPVSVFSQFTDLSFVEGRNVYYITSRSENSPSDTLFDKAENVPAISYNRRNVYWWMTGWRPGPLILLDRNTGYDMVVDIFDLTEVFNSDNGATNVPISWESLP